MTDVPAATGAGLRLARQARGLSQQQLAGMAGVSRQAVSAVESGHSDPSLRVALALSRALGMTVEELFGPGEPADPVHARPVAQAAGPGQGAFAEGSRVALATVGDVFVALPLCGGNVSQGGFAPAGGLVAWARQGRGGGTIGVRPIGPPRSTLVVAGCDPALPLLQTPLALLDPPVAFAWWPCGSAEALRLAAAGLVHVAGVHPGGAGPELDDAEVAGFASWREGLAIRPGATVASLEDVANRGLRLVNREPGAQARTLLDQERERLGLTEGDLRGYDTQATGHLQVAAAVAGRLADAGVTSEPAALAYGLGFVPLADERFELVLPAKQAASREVQALLKVLSSPWLHAQLAGLPGYDPASCGERRLVPVDRDEQRPGDGVEPQVEAGHGGGDRVVHVQRRNVQRVHREHVPVRRVPGRRRGAAEVLRPVVIADVERAAGQPGTRAGAGRQRRHRGRQVEQHPVPEAGAGRGVRVVAGDREARGLRRETRPGQRRRDVLPGHPEAVVHLLRGHHLTIGDVVATQLERRHRGQEVIGERRTIGHYYLHVGA
jgi:molybdate-binding protein/transcriptional regulator with XRE-family HTH domain